VGVNDGNVAAGNIDVDCNLAYFRADLKPDKVTVVIRRLHSLIAQVYCVKALARRQLGIDRFHVDGDVERVRSAAKD
jgi:hypothetical protein